MGSARCVPGSALPRAIPSPFASPGSHLLVPTVAAQSAILRAPPRFRAHPASLPSGARFGIMECFEERGMGSCMVAEIISVGTELLLGQTLDTNSAFLSKTLAA